MRVPKLLGRFNSFCLVLDVLGIEKHRVQSWCSLCLLDCCVTTFMPISMSMNMYMFVYNVRMYEYVYVYECHDENVNVVIMKMSL